MAKVETMTIKLELDANLIERIREIVREELRDQRFMVDMGGVTELPTRDDVA